MRFLVIFLFVTTAFAFAQAPTDTLYTQGRPVGVWHTTSKKDLGTIVWFHGGMTSRNCQKGLVAGSDLSTMLPAYTVVSASACMQNHWVEQATIESVDSALDSIAKRQKKTIDEISLVGISDGSLGVIAYSLWGKRKIKNRVLMSSYGEALGPAAQVALQPPMKSGRWRFIQGGNDRLYPADKTAPWIQEFCQNVGTTCDLKFDPQGEHDWSYWQNKHKDWILEIFSK